MGHDSAAAQMAGRWHAQLEVNMSSSQLLSLKSIAGPFVPRFWDVYQVPPVLHELFMAGANCLAEVGDAC